MNSIVQKVPYFIRNVVTDLKVYDPKKLKDYGEKIVKKL